MEVPRSRPRISREQLAELMKPYEVKSKLVIVGIRGYYLDSMGEAGENDRAIYDDALFVVSPESTVSYNGNTDPSAYRQGIASLVPGYWPAYKLDYHRGDYLALCQRNGPVTVTRDGQANETGDFGINIHRGSYNSTSSLGCQTLYPAQWESFINLVADQAKRLYAENWNRKTIPYLLLEVDHWEGDRLVVK